jgi:hypothetical protein
MGYRKSARALMIVAGGLIAAIPATTEPAEAQNTPGGAGIVTPNCNLARRNRTGPAGIVCPGARKSRAGIVCPGERRSKKGRTGIVEPCELRRKNK